MWSGGDSPGGSGLADYSIYVSDNGGPYMVWLANTTVTDAPFVGEYGHAYSLYSSARDNAGNSELPPAQPDAMIQLIDPAMLTDQDGDGVPDLQDNCPLAGNSQQTDIDGDGVGDACDNCIQYSNGQQQDTDNDGYGNRCDADLNNDDSTNSLDLGLFKQVFFTQDQHSDINSDGIVNSLDLGLLKQLFFKSPGPSAFVP
jgi:hypothetical protein